MSSITANIGNTNPGHFCQTVFSINLRSIAIWVPDAARAHLVGLMNSCYASMDSPFSSMNSKKLFLFGSLN